MPVTVKILTDCTVSLGLPDCDAVSLPAGTVVKVLNGDCRLVTVVVPNATRPDGRPLTVTIPARLVAAVDPRPREVP